LSGEEPRPVEELVARADEVLSAVADSGGTMRLMGGVAVRLRASDLGGIEPSRRAYHDIDLVGRLRDVRVIDAAFVQLGYEPDRAINTQFGTVRRVYHHPDGFHADLFFERLEFCHTIELNGRLSLVPRTTSPTDLLLQKLQIVERNEKDLIDASWLLLNHAIGAGDPAQLQADYLVRLTGNDWGLHTTAGDFLADAATRLDSLGLNADAAARVGAAIGALQAAMDEAPKSLRWKARDRVGRRVRWYRTVEEVL
jgi:hypothetical protein